jgi:hypothetical protein
VSTPFDKPDLELTDADRAEWERWEKANRAAAEQYEALPTSFHRAAAAVTCACGTTTLNLGGVCGECRKGTS